MIYDRTHLDVIAALQIRENYVKKFAALTDTQLQTIERGMITYNTLNRIEDKQRELMELINSTGKFSISIHNKTWSKEDEFDGDNYVRILDNLRILRDTGFVLKDTPQVPRRPVYNYAVLNAIEKILSDIDYCIKDTVYRYAKSDIDGQSFFG